MTDKKIIEALAKLNSDIYEMDDINHDLLQFIIDSLDWDAFIQYTEELWAMRDDGFSWSTRIAHTYRASIGDKVDAILKATGDWNDE